MGSVTSETERDQPTREGVLTRVAGWSSTHPWTALGLWVLAIIVTFSINFFVDTRQATETEMLTGESQRAARLAEAAGHQDRAIEFVFLTQTGAEAWNSASAVAVLTQANDALVSTPHVEDVVGPLASEDGTTMVFHVTIAGDADTAGERVQPLNDAVAALNSDFPTVLIRQTGSVSIADDFNAWLGDALDRATAVSVPLTLVVLLIAFAAWMMSLVPLIVGAAAVLSAMGLWAVASQIIPDHGLVPHVILLIGLAVGVDYALFSLRRFREESNTGSNAEQARTVAARTAGHSVIVSGTAVALAMAGLLLMQETLFSGVAIGAILVVLVAMLSSLTAMPALLRLLGRWIDHPRVPFVWRVTNNGREPRLLRRMLRPVIQNPLIALAVSAALLALMALPALGMKLTTTTIDDYPRSLTSLQAYDALLAAYPDNTSSARVVITTATPDEQGLLHAAHEVNERTGHQSGRFGKPADPWMSEDGRSLVLDIPVLHRSATPAAQNAIIELRTAIVPAATAELDTTDYAVGGAIAGNLDATQNLAERLPWVILAVLAMTFAFMLAVYRSMLIAVTTILLNIASTLASFGLLTLMFQSTWAQSFLGFESNGHLVSWVPLMLFVVLSGLSLDYHVLVINRIRESARAA